MDGDEIIDDGIVRIAEVNSPPAGKRPSDGIKGPVAATAEVNQPVEVVELSVHGGVRIVERILMVAERAGARVVRGNDACGPAIAGEAGSDAHEEMNIDEEAAECLTAARTRRCVRFISRQRTLLPAVLEEIAVALDTDPDECRTRLQQLLDRSRSARFLLTEATVALFGPVNAGKSTLINRLSERESSIVSPLPGTTRDWVDATVSIEGVPLRLVDTAGIREATDALERDAALRGLVRVADADVRVAVLDGSVEFPGAFWERCGDMLAGRRALVVLNKCDLPAAWDAARVREPGRAVVRVSGRTGEGIADLVQAILSNLSIADLGEELACPFTARQIEWISQLLSGDIGGVAGGALRAAAHLRGRVKRGVPGI